MKNATNITDTLIKDKDRARELYAEVSTWVNTTFNYIDVSVYQKMADDCLFDYIRQAPLSGYADNFDDYLTNDEAEKWVQEYLEEEDMEGNKPKECVKYLKAVKDNYSRTEFENIFGKEELANLIKWVEEHKEDELREFSYEDENYPMWNTLFEFKECMYGSEDDIEKAQAVGLGVIEGLEPFETTVFMMSCGHSFYGSYWIPLYLKLHDKEKEYEGVDYSMF